MALRSLRFRQPLAAFFTHILLRRRFGACKLAPVAIRDLTRPEMNTLPKTAVLAAALLLAAGCNRSAPAADPRSDESAIASTADAAPAAEVAPAADGTASAPQLRAAMRDLWNGHIVHAREYAMAVHAGDEAAADTAADAVVDNARQIADAVGGFYGKAGGERMMTLLAGHWGAVKAMTDARADGDEAAATTAMNDLTANAGAIAAFLAGANPNLPEEAVRPMLLAHGAHHARQIQLVMAGDTAGEAREWAAMQSHMEMVADALADAIARQFPDKAD